MRWRAALVVVAAVGLGVLIFHSGAAPAGVATSSATTTTTTRPQSTTTTTTRPQSTTTTTTIPRKDVKVLVANASTTNGVAAAYSTVLEQAGWTVLTPVTAKPPTRATSAVYYAANKTAEADAVAAAFGLSSSDVGPISSAIPVDSVGDADVVLVIGSDLAAKTPTTVPPTSSTTTSTTSATRTHGSRTH